MLSTIPIANLGVIMTTIPKTWGIPKDPAYFSSLFNTFSHADNRKKILVFWNAFSTWKLRRWCDPFHVKKGRYSYWTSLHQRQCLVVGMCWAYVPPGPLIADVIKQLVQRGGPPRAEQMMLLVKNCASCYSALGRGCSFSTLVVYAAAMARFTMTWIEPDPGQFAMVYALALHH